MSKESFSARLDADIKARLEAEAESEGKSASAHAEAIIADHLAGKSVERLGTEVAKLTDELASIRQSIDHGLRGMRAAQDLRTKAILFGLETVILNLPTGGKKAVELFRARYIEELEKGG